MACYFAYGSNMHRQRLLERVGSARSLGAAQVQDFVLRFDKPGRDGSGKANLVPAPGALAWGVAWSVTEAALDRLDRFEPGYRRELFWLETAAGERVRATTYLYPRPPHGPEPGEDKGPSAASPTGLIPPTDAYLQYLLAGAREHGLPASWIRAIRDAARGG